MHCYTTAKAHFLPRIIKKEQVISVSNDKILGLSKMKAFEDDKLKVTQMMNTVLDRVENIVGKGENAGYQCFLLLPRCFQNPYS